MLFLYVNTKSAKRIDLPRSAESTAEYYWTWQVVSGNNGEISIAQGFSMLPRVDKGTPFKEGEVFDDINDPKFMIQLPDVREGEIKTATIEFFGWEHDSDENTMEIKKIFSNSMTKKLIAVMEKHRNQTQEVLKELQAWVKGEDLSAIVSAIGSSMTFPLIPIISSAVNLIPDLAFLIQGADDYLCRKTVDIIYTKDKNTRQYMYQFVADDGFKTSGFIPFTQELHRRAVKFINAKRNHEVHLDIIYQMKTSE